MADANDTGGGVQARSETERAILRQLPQLREGAEVRVGDVSVIADGAYAAASGRTCRAVHVTAHVDRAVQDRLVCSDGRAWFFVPDVLGADSKPE